MSVHGPNREIEAEAVYIDGYADSIEAGGHKHIADKLRRLAERLRKMARQTCGSGYVGCYGGPDCTADHK